MNKFFKNTFTIVILSEMEPVDNIRLEDMNEFVTTGHGNLYSMNCKVKEIRPKTAAKLLIDSGSDPEFFGINEKGEEIDE